MEIDNTIMWKKVTYPEIEKDRYLISENGILYDGLKCIYKKKCYINTKSKDPYIAYYLHKENGGQAFVFAHRLVAWEFLPEKRDMSLTVDHLYGNTQDNDYRHLEWVTNSENVRRMLKRTKVSTKIPDSEVHKVCSLFVQGKDPLDIMMDKYGENVDVQGKEHNAEYAFLCRLRSGKYRTEITSLYDFPRKPRVDNDRFVKRMNLQNRSQTVYNEEIVRYVCRSLEKGRKYIQLAEELSGTTDHSDVRYKRYKDFIQSVGERKRWTQISSEYNFTHESGLTLGTFDDTELLSLIKKGLSQKEIREYYGVDKKSNSGLCARIQQTHHRYHMMHNIPEGKSIDIVKEGFIIDSTQSDN